MKKCIYIAALILFFTACNSSDTEDVCQSPDYSNCNTAKPDEGTLNVKVTINNENCFVPLTVYLGNLEENNVYIKDTAFDNFWSAEVPVGYFYTVTAKYRKGTDVIMAVGGDNVKATKSDYCDSTCWSVKQGSVNVRLK